MFGTLGFSELIIILVIVLIIFGAGRLPQIGEGVGKALKGFKKEVQDIPQPEDFNQPGPVSENTPSPQPPVGQQAGPAVPQESLEAQPFQPGPEQTPGTTAAMAYSGVRPEVVQPKPQSSHVAAAAGTTAPVSSVPPPVTMEQRAAASIPQGQPQYPPLPPSARTQGPSGTRPATIVNKEAVARVQAQRAAKQAQAAQRSSGTAPQDMQSLGEGLGGALRTFREAAADVRNSIDPEMRTIQAELESAQKEVEGTIEAAKQPPLPKEPPSTV